ncbi:2-polyprenyl-6-methoxyphenol hydroxylase-like FAD-dependent oxidoreductase [Nonomuraea polychroma]|uniref:2-polyprenyl-6-methoxyphenol hydroxylase-like FAD-dependent oxidoreductase n=1 Tax=Nonomuraea polychroma TaxID=46176 RepID=A0A438MJW4_9ACTN|nr:FAD-dependent monooxygenase [Nonomuraea polychroma]RVX46212.1 2-polyprenyl-6-methoxyphenol hydroxylase-like FAD-dependent oxidoreductase [Nonomuraea polychroma]
MRIVVVGGGIGGLALAAGLRRHGFNVAVLERDTDVTATGGYHITLDGRAQEALRQLVPPKLVEQLLASSSALRLRDPDAFWDRHGRLLGYGPQLADSPSVDIDRITLRTLLADAVGEDLHLGQTVTGLGYADDGTPQVVLADGSIRECDLLVGADGTHSLVARHLAGGPTSAPAGIVGFSGRTAAENLSPLEQQRLGTRSGMVIAPRGAALYVGFLDPVGNAVLDAPDQRAAITSGPTYIWGAMFPESAETDSIRGLRGEELRDALLARFRRQGWGERPLEVIVKADPGSIAAFRFNAASSRVRDLAPWPAGRITALGDAVHATPPTAGMGAGAAIRDAASLLTHLREVTDGSCTLPVAVSQFEAGMRVRGSEILILAMRTVRWILATDTPLGAAVTAAAAPVIAAVRQLRRQR